MYIYVRRCVKFVSTWNVRMNVAMHISRYECVYEYICLKTYV